MQKNILITGVSSGIGEDACRKFIQEGWKVMGSVRKLADADRLSKRLGTSFLALLFDVQDENAILSSKNAVISFCGERGLDGIINNAGYAHPGPMTELATDELSKQLDVNVLGVMRITNCFYDLLKVNAIKKEAGRIINISSISGLFNSPFVGAYCVSKHAVESLTEIYRRELYLFDIDVIAIQPGPIKTKIWGKSKGKLDRFFDSDYGKYLRFADNNINASEKHAIEVEKVSDLLFKRMRKKTFKTKNIIHKNKLGFNLVRKLVPARLTDKLIWKMLSKKNPKNRPV